jgi:small GTP-binding protein
MASSIFGRLYDYNNNNNFSPLIYKPLSIKYIDYIPCGVILGQIGVGKTTVFNLLCGTHHSAEEAAGSVTKKLYFHSVNVGNYPFNLIDTPGMNSKHETYKHAVLIRESLTAKKVNTIFIIVKFESRYEEILDAFLEVQELVYQYNEKIVLMVSHWDACKYPRKAFDEICKMFNNCCSNIICYSEKSSPKELVKLMYSCLSSMRTEMLEIKDDDFFLRYNICEQKASLTKSIKEYEMNLRKSSADYSEQLKTIIQKDASEEERDDILHCLIVSYRNEIEGLGDEFIRKHSGDLTEMHHFTLFIKIQKTNIKFCDEFVDLVVPYMSYNPSDVGDPRNMIRSCPYCNEIWWKTEGCDGQTNCGNVPTSYFDMKTKPASFVRYVFIRVNGFLSCKQNVVALQTPSKVVKKSKNAGCGKPIVWKDCPKVSNEKILELFKVKTLDQAKQIIKEANFQEIRENIEATIDKDFQMD